MDDALAGGVAAPDNMQQQVVQEDQTWMLGVLAVITVATLAYLLRPDGGASARDDDDGPPKPPTVKQDMTLRQLREYNGTNGKPIYVAVKGEIFNVSSHPSGVELYGG